MSRSVTRKSQQPPEVHRELDVVRATKAIPVMSRSVEQAQPEAAPRALPCSGRCGHCEIHPCQLHAPI